MGLARTVMPQTLGLIVPMLLMIGEMYTMATSEGGDKIAWHLSPLCKVAIAVSLGVSCLL